MKTKPKRCWPSRRRGMTLVEAAVGMAIMATLLTAVVMSVSKLSRQSQAAQERLAACEVADSLLETWWATPEGVPDQGQGTIQGRQGWTWRITAETSQVQSDNAGLDAETVVLEVFAPGEGANRNPSAVVHLLVARKDSDAR